jgi:nitroreductase
MSAAIIDAILKRRSIREFTEQEVETAQLREMVRAGTWAPSGLNNQPWRFVLVQDNSVMVQLAAHTRYSHIILAAPALIVVFLERKAMYDDLKDAQAAGACIQNMLLAAEALGLGAVWLGQILQNREKVNEILALDQGLELMAVIAVGHPAHRKQKSRRKPLTDFIVREL